MFQHRLLPISGSKRWEGTYVGDWKSGHKEGHDDVVERGEVRRGLVEGEGRGKGNVDVIRGADDGSWQNGQSEGQGTS